MKKTNKKEKKMDYNKFEKKVIEIIDDYGAPENITDEIKEFLFGSSNNIYSIIEFVKELNEE